jgi:hypothetical protein
MKVLEMAKQQILSVNNLICFTFLTGIMAHAFVLPQPEWSMQGESATSSLSHFAKQQESKRLPEY